MYISLSCINFNTTVYHATIDRVIVYLLFKRQIECNK